MGYAVKLQKGGKIETLFLSITRTNTPQTYKVYNGSLARLANFSTVPFGRFSKIVNGVYSIVQKGGYDNTGYESYNPSTYELTIGYSDTDQLCLLTRLL